MAAVWGLPAAGAEHARIRDLSGKWLMKVEKPGSVKAEVTTMIIEQNGDLIRWTATVDGSDGSRVVQTYDGALDGQPHAVLQNGLKMAEIAYTPVGPSTIESVSILPDGKKSRATHILAPDGKTLTTQVASGGVTVWRKLSASPQDGAGPSR